MPQIKAKRYGYSFWVLKIVIVGFLDQNIQKKKYISDNLQNGAKVLKKIAVDPFRGVLECAKMSNTNLQGGFRC